MAKLLGLDKLAKFVQIIKDNGGVKASLYKLYRFDDLRTGKLVGIDKYGNKYYENRAFFIGRSRWIEYADYYGMDYDGSQIPPEWFGWIHYKSDLPPTEDPTRPKHKWMLDHVENLTGTPEEYVPYSTTPSKIKAWVPPKRS